MSNNEPPFDREQRIALTRRAFRLLADWSVPKELQPQILGLDPALRTRQVNRYRLGTPLPEEGDSYQRIALLLDIDNMLRKMFPHSVLSANLWITTPNLHYGQHTPLDTIVRDGLEGIYRVESALSRRGPW